MTDVPELSKTVPVPEGLFKDVKYVSIGNIPQSIEEMLNVGGAKKDRYGISEMITHVIADIDDDDEVTEAKDLYELAVVKHSWVVMSVQCGSLLPTALFDPDKKNMFFSQVVVCPSQLSANDAKVIWAMVTRHGGTYQTTLNKHVTHLVTASTNTVSNLNCKLSKQCI